MRLQPQRASGNGRLHAGLLPPGRFPAAAMDLAMMAATERHGELITGLAAERWRSADDGDLTACGHKSDRPAWRQI